MNGGPDLDDILAQMFGMGPGMGPGMPGHGGPRSSKPRKGRNEDQKYEVTLEDLYKGKTVKFASTKNVICDHCKGKGGKDKAKSKTCSVCGGQGKFFFRKKFYASMSASTSHNFFVQMSYKCPLTG